MSVAQQMAISTGKPSWASLAISLGQAVVGQAKICRKGDAIAARLYGIVKAKKFDCSQWEVLLLWSAGSSRP